MNLSSKTTERIVYSINALFVAAFIGVNSFRDLASEKALFIYSGWILIGIYFLTLTLTFYESNIRDTKGLKPMFKVVSLIPLLFLVPITWIHGIGIFVMFDLWSLLIVLGGLLWIGATILNLALKS